jgi:hypothetical protein
VVSGTLTIRGGERQCFKGGNMAMKHKTRGIKLAAGAAAAVLAMTGCSHGLSGTYVPAGSGMGNGLVMEKLEFESSHDVTLTMMQQRIRVTYQVDGKQLLLSANGQQMVFEIVPGNCLDGGGLYGKFCKS